MSALFGFVSLSTGTTTGTVTFPVPLTVSPNLVLGVANTVDVSPAQSLAELSPVVTSILQPTVGSFTGFTYRLKVAPATANWQLCYGLDANAVAMSVQSVVTNGRSLLHLGEKETAVSPYDRLLAVDRSRTKPRLVELGIAKLLSLFSGIIATPPASPNSEATRNSITTTNVGGKYFLNVGVAPNLVGRVALNATNWNIPDSTGYRQRFSLQMASGVGIQTVTFAFPFASSPVLPPIITGMVVRCTDVTDSVSVISGIVKDVTHLGFRFICTAPPTGNYFLEGEAVQEV